MEIYLLRHTTPQVEKGICYGQTDLPLIPTFQQEIEEALSQLPKSFDSIYSSPLQRCETLAAAVATSYSVDERLKEVNFGDWEMMDWNDIPQAELMKWMQSFETVAPPNGESAQDLYRRVLDFYNSELLSNPSSRVLLVTHHGVIRCFHALLHQTSMASSFENCKVPYGGMVHFSVKE